MKRMEPERITLHPCPRCGYLHTNLCSAGNAKWTYCHGCAEAERKREPNQWQRKSPIYGFWPEPVEYVLASTATEEGQP